MRQQKTNLLIISYLVLIPLCLSAKSSMNARIREVPAEIRSESFSNPKKALPDLVENLVSGIKDEKLKARILHDWICDNIAYNAEMYFSGSEKKQDYSSVLKGRKALSSGYARLYAQMCSNAGLDCTIVKGFLKGHGYGGTLPEKENHSWNAVKINGKWNLVDVTLDAGSLEQRTFIKRYSTQWFCRDAKEFLYSHLPADEQQQFAAASDIKTKEEFQNEPYIPGVFFDYGFNFSQERPSCNTVISAPVSYSFTQSKRNVALLGGISTKDDLSKIENATWINRNANLVTITFDVPDAKEYQASLYACYADQETYPWFFSQAEYEGQILPKAEQLLQNGEISQDEFDYLENSYFKVNYNKRYYLAEDLFDNERNEAVRKIFRLIGLTPSSMEEILAFSIRTDGVYPGFGHGTLNYPTAYTEYTLTRNTELISPLKGILKNGESIVFEIASGDYKSIALSADDGELIKLEKNPESGHFEKECIIGENEFANAHSIKVYGSTDNHQYEGLWGYKIE